MVEFERITASAAV